MSNFNPNENNLTIPLTGRQMIKRPPKSALTPRRPGKNPIFDAQSVEEQTQVYNIVNPGGSESDTLLTARSPSLLAFRNKTIKARPQTALIGNRDKKKKKEAEIISPRNTSTLLTKRPGSAMRESARKVPETITKEINSEKLSIAFDEDPIAYFSKRKDGRGHRFIYLNHAGDRSDPFFNPYQLVKVPFAEVHSEYFTMSANGVTHVQSNGNTEHVSLDKWSKESLLFSTIRKLKLFSQFFYWKPFRIWKKFVMRQRYSELSSAIFAHPFFTQSGFFQTQLQIRNVLIDADTQTTVEMMITQYLLAFAREKKYELKEYFETISDNVEHLNKCYTEYIKEITEEILALDAKIRDPRILQVKDSDFPEIKRRNPNLAQLMILEKKKAERRVELTKMVNGQILALGNFILDIDYMLLESIAQTGRECWRRAAKIIFSDNSAVFQVQVTFSDNGKIVFTPTLERLVEAIHSSLRGSLVTAANLPRLLTDIKLRAHVRESYPDYKILVETGPHIERMIERDGELKEIEDQIIEYINESYKKAQIEAQKFTDFYSIYEIGKSWDVKQYIKTRSGKPYELPSEQKSEEMNSSVDINFEDEPIVDMRSVRRDIQVFTNDHNRLDGFNLSPYCNAIYINSRSLLNELKPIPMNTLETLRTTLRNLLNDKVDRIKNALANYSKELKIEPKNLQQFVHYCEMITKTSELQPTIQEEINFIDDMYRLFGAFTMHIDVTEENQNPLPPQMQLFITAQQVAQTIKENNMEHFTKNLEEITKKLENKLQKYLDMASSQPSSIADTETERLKGDIQQIRAKVRKIDPEIKTYLHYQKVLGVNYCDFKSLHEVNEALNFDEKLFTAVSKWQLLEATSIKSPFSSIDIDHFSKSVKSLQEDLNDLNSVTRLPTPLLSELTMKLNSVAPYLDQIQLLATSNMQQRHWQALLEDCGITSGYHSGIKLDEIISMGLLSNKDRIASETSVAIGESQLEEEFKEIQNRWSSIQLPTVDGQAKSEDSLLLNNVDDMITEIEDSVLSLTRMMSLPFVHGVKDQVTKLQAQLESSALILDAWQLFQRNWVLLSSLFSHEDAKNSLQQQTTRFNWVRRRWVSIVRHASKDLALLVVCQFPSLLEMMKENNAALEGILSSLGLFVDSKRTIVPRLFVLGNYDVLQLVSFTDLTQIRPIMARLFMNMVDIDTNGNTSTTQNNNLQYQRIRVYGLICDNKESFLFPKNILISGSIDHWLPSLVDIMKVSFVDSFSSLISKMDNQQLADWILSVPTHMMYLALQVWFTREVDECFNQLETNIHSFDNYDNKLQEKYIELLALLDTPLTKVESEKTATALTLISNYIETTKYLGLDQNNKWWWSQHPKLRYSKESQKMTIVINDETTEFGWELWGKIRPAIMTPSMQRSIHSAASDRNSMILGSHGTGRRTCIENLAMLYGRYLYHVPAFPDFSELVITRIISGVSMMGAWALFADIDQLPSSAISKLYDQIYIHSDGLQSGLTRIMIDGKPTELNSSSRIFFTTSSSPTELPSQFKAKAKPVALSAPERKVLIEIQLTAFGFKTAKSLSPKIDSVLPLIVLSFKNQLFSKSIFAHISYIIKEMKNLAMEVRDQSFTLKFDSSRIAEEYVAARSLYLHFSRFIYENELDLLLSLIFNVFHLFDNFDKFKGKIINPNCFKDDNELDALAVCMKSFIRNTLPLTYIENQTLNLFSLLITHRIVIVHGASQSGKSSVINLLKQSVNKLADEMKQTSNFNLVQQYRHIKRIKIETFYNSSDSWNRNFGYLMSDQATGTIWSHGKLSSYLNHLRENSENCMKILVFDGYMDDTFVNFVSQIATNDISKLNSFDYLNFNDDFRIIIKTCSIDKLNPSLIPFCGFLPMKSIHKNDFNDDMQLILLKVFDNCDKIKTMFEEVVNLTIKYIYHIDNKVSCVNSTNSMKDGDVILFNRLPFQAAVLLKNLIDNNYINSDDSDQLAIAVIHSIFNAFQSILNYKQKVAFDQWIRSSFHLLINDYSFELPKIFTDVFPHPCLSSHSVVNGKFEIKSNEIIKENVITFPNSNVFIENKIVPTVQFIEQTELLTTYLNQKQNILFTGEYGKTSFLRYFFMKNIEIFNPIYVQCSSTKTSESILNFIDLHTLMTTKFVNHSKRVVFVFEDISFDNLEVIEFIRQFIKTSSLKLTSQCDPKLYDVITLRDFSIICTTSDFSKLPTQFVSLFCLLKANELTMDEIKYVLVNLMNSYEVSSEFSNEIIQFLNACMVSIDEFPRTINYLTKFINLICRMGEKSNKNENDKETLLRTVVSEIDAYVISKNPLVTKEQLLKVINNHYPDSKSSSDIKGDVSLFYTEFSTDNENSLVVKSAAHETTFIKEELEFYLQVYNNSASEKIVLKFFNPVIKQWSLMHRAFTCPGCHAILRGKEGSGRFTLTRFVAHMSEFDFIHINSLHKSTEHLYSVLRDIVTNLVLLNKKSILFIRHKNKQVSPTLKIILDFVETQDFSLFFPKTALEDLYTKFASGQAQKAEQRYLLFNQIRHIIKSNFHVSIAVDEHAVPLLVKRDFIDIQFIPFTKDELIDTAAYSLSQPMFNNILGSYQQQIPKIIQRMHEIVVNNHSFVSLNNYYDFIDNFALTVSNDYQEIFTRSGQLVAAIRFLNELDEEGQSVERKLDSIAPNLQRITMDCDALNASFTSKKEAIAARKKQIDEDLKEKSDQVKKTQNELNQLKTTVDSLLPQVMTLQKQIENLTTNDIETIRINADDPSASLKMLLEVLCIFLDYPISYERGGYKLLMDNDFVQLILHKINYQIISPSIVQKVLPYFDDPHFTSNEMGLVAPALQNIFDWITAICKLANCSDQMSKKKEELEEVQKEFNTTVEESKLEQQSILQVEEQLEEEVKYLDTSMTSKQQFESEYQQINTKKINITRILKDMDKLIEKWTNESQSITSQRDMIVGDALVYAFYITYCGMFIEDERNNLLQQILSEISAAGFSTSFSDPLLAMNDRFLRANYTDSAFNIEQQYVYNASLDLYHSNSTIRVPLIIDPDYLLEFYFSKSNQYKNLVMASQTTSNLDQVLASAVSEGRTLVLFDVDYLHPYVSPLLSLYRLGKSDTLSKEIRIGTKMVTWDSKFKLILFTSHRHVEEIPNELYVRVNVIDVSSSSYEAMRHILNNTFIEFFDSINLPRLSESSRMEMECRVSQEKHEKNILESIADAVATLQTNPNFDFLSDEETMRDINQSKELYFSAVERYQTFESNKGDVNKITQPYAMTIDMLMIVWKAISRYLVKLNKFNSVSYAAFATVISNALQMPGVAKPMNNEQQYNLSILIISQILNWIFPSISFGDSIVLMFVIQFLRLENNEKVTQNDLDVVLRHLTDELNSSVDLASNEIGIGDPFEHLKFANIKNIFSFVQRFISEMFGNEFQNTIPIFQVENIISQNASMPTLIVSDKNKNCSDLIQQYISTKTRGDNFEPISFYDSPEFVKNARKVIITAMSRGTRILLHISMKSTEASSLISDIYQTMLTTSLHTNFRLIISCTSNCIDCIPHKLIENSRKLRFDQFPSIRHNMLQIYHHHQTTVKSTMNPKAIKKLTYATTLAYSLIEFRNFLKSFSFHSYFDVSNQIIHEIIDTFRVVIDTSTNVPMNFFREYIQDNCYGTSVVDSNDRRVIRSLLFSIFANNFMDDDFSYCNEFPDSDRYQLPNEMPLSNYNNYIQKMPVFPSADGLLIKRSCSSPIRDWCFSRFITKRILKLNPREITSIKQAQLNARLESYLLSLPDQISTEKMKITPLMKILKIEIDEFNSFISMIRNELTRLTDDCYMFVNGTVPMKWRNMVYFDSSHQSARFISFLNEKRSYLDECARMNSISNAKVNYFANLRSLLFAFVSEMAAKKGLTTDSVTIDFSTTNSNSAPNDSLVLSGLTLMCGTYFDDVLIVNNQTKALQQFPNVVCSLTKAAKSSNFVFMCPLYRTFYVDSKTSRNNLFDYVDGQSENLIWYIPMRTESPQAELITNGTSLVCVLPEQFIL